MSSFNLQPVNFTLVAVSTIPQPYVIVQGSGDYGTLALTKTLPLAGVAQAAVNSGEFVGICPFGESKVVAGAAITAGARITTNTSGRAVAAGSGDVILGYARQTAGADGDVIKAFIAAFGDKMIA